MLAIRAGLLAAALLLAPLSALRAADAPLSLPPPAPVVDEYGLLGSSEAARLDQLVRQIKGRSGVEVTVFVPSSLRGLEIEDFSIRVGEQWKLGRKKEDKGLLLIIAPKERKMRIEVGYGLEGELTDVYTRHVLDDGMRPYFKQGRYYDGILNGLTLIQQKVPLGLEQAEATAAPAPDDASAAMGPGLKLFLFLLLIFYLLSRLSRLGGGYRRGYYGGWWGGGGGGWGGGSSGGSSWGGGGGSFGGGGSSSSW